MIHREVAKKFNLKLIDIRVSACEPPDFNGFIFADKETKTAGYIPLDMFPTEDMEVPDGYDGWLVFLDEVTTAADDMQAPMYRIILDRLVGQKKLHPKCMISSAGNPVDSGCIAYEMSDALLTRFIHIYLRSDYQSFRNKAIELNIDHRIRSFIDWKPGNINRHNPDSSADESTFPCERTWHFLSDLMLHCDPEDPLALPIYAGTVGEGMAREFIAYCKVFHTLPAISRIQNDPDTTEVPHQPGHLYALTGAIADHANEDNVDQLIKYVRRMPLDFQVVCLRQIVFKNRALMSKSQGIKNWITINSAELF
jgi:hypothetical protein